VYSNGTKPPSLIVGITNPFLLKSFSHFESSIFLPLYDLPPQVSGAAAASAVSTNSAKANVTECTSPFSAARGQRKSLYSSRSSSHDKGDGIETRSAGIALDIGSRGSGKMPFISLGKERDHVTHLNETDLRSSPAPLPSQAKPKIENPSSVAVGEFPCNVNRIGPNTSLESVHDKWVTSGGAGTMQNGVKNTMICIRHPVSVKPDTRILQLINSASIGEILTSQQQPLSSLFSSVSMCGPSYADMMKQEVESSERDRRDIQANMLIREHFRQLTCWLMKPFEGHFQARSDLERSLPSPSPSWSPLSSPAAAGSFFPDGNSLPSEAPRSVHSVVDGVSASIGPVEDRPASHRSPLSLQIAAQQQSPHRRRGASSLWLYRNPVELLGGESINSSIKKYRKSGRHIPECFLSSRRQELYSSFAESDTFQNYYRWRKRNLTAQMLMEMALACCSLSGKELIEQFAIEKGSDVITQVQMKELEARINMYIRALSTVQSKPSQTIWLIRKMQEHLQTISELWR
jgi:hypothetical protein